MPFDLQKIDESPSPEFTAAWNALVSAVKALLSAVFGIDASSNLELVGGSLRARVRYSGAVALTGDDGIDAAADADHPAVATVTLRTFDGTTFSNHAEVRCFNMAVGPDGAVAPNVNIQMKLMYGRFWFVDWEQCAV